ANKPGDKFEYCNAAYALLAAIVEKASGQSFEQYLREQLFAPAGMKDTGFLNDEKLDKKRAASRLRENEVDRTAAEWSWSWGYRGMGGVVTTAEDLLRFDRSLRANEVLAAAAQTKQTTPVKEVAGCGCFIERTFRATTKVYHTGGVAGFTAMFARYLEDDLVVVVLSNEAGDPSGLEAALVNAVFPPPTASVVLDLNPRPPESGVLVIKEGTAWKGERAEKEVVLRVKWADATPATVKLPFDSAKGLATMLKDALDARARENAAEGDKPDMESCLYTTQYELEDNKVELAKLSLKVLGKYVTERNGEEVVDPRITLVVVDTAASFWPLIVKMNSAAAKQLLGEIERGLKE
ncbi:MAG: serine hydrolase domain-containing protein, partial [Planctomycetota bacterium]